MSELSYMEVIGKAAKRLNEVYFVIGNTDRYEDLMKGVCIGLGVAFDTEPQSIEYSINNYEG